MPTQFVYALYTLFLYAHIHFEMNLTCISKVLFLAFRANAVFKLSFSLCLGCENESIESLVKCNYCNVSLCRFQAHSSYTIFIKSHLMMNTSKNGENCLHVGEWMNELTDGVFFSSQGNCRSLVVGLCAFVTYSGSHTMFFVHLSTHNWNFFRICFDFGSIFGQHSPCLWCITPPISISLQVIWVKWLYDYIVRAYFGCSGLTRMVLSLDIIFRHCVMHNQSECIYVSVYAVSVFNASNSQSCDLTLEYMCAFVLC